ncbi:hypothetical protein GOBAR_AA32778 [Gossypium barbadense]|uniref:Uncharacterized protein n=1 Tax=Gossypium barbadense TaxID=3634 RepID=A0A2P5W9Z1_GOSBA|nr:hypothetical protein GOBAR_AA32778 [Gossypium barbadense]
MLSKFILVSETHFHNTETTLKNHQASIQRLETHIGQLSRLISERPQGSLPSNTEPNLKEQLNTINVQDEEGFIEPEPESRQETMVRRGQGEEISLKEVHEPFSSNGRGPIHEERRLQIEELDEWQMHKPRTYDKLELRQNKLNTFPHQLKVGDKVLLDTADPHIVTTTPNEEIPLTVLGIFPFSTVEVSHLKFDTFKVNNSRLKPYFDENDSRNEEYHIILTWLKGHCPCFKEKEGSVIFLGSYCGSLPPFTEIVMTNYDDPGTVQFRLGGLIRQLSVPEFGTALGLYTEEFKEENNLHALNRHIHRSPLRCWDALVPGGATYNPSRSKASALPPSLRYLQPILAHTIIERRESISVTKRHKKGVISIGPYVTRLAGHFELLSNAAQESSLTLIGQMSPQGISSILSMRMIEKRRGTYPLQYRLAQSTEEEAYEDIPDNVPPQHKDPLTQPPPPSRSVHAAASYADILSDLWTNEPLPPPEHPPSLSHRLLSKTPVLGIHHTGSFTSPPIL